MKALNFLFLVLLRVCVRGFVSCSENRVKSSYSHLNSTGEYFWGKKADKFSAMKALCLFFIIIFFFSVYIYIHEFVLRTEKWSNKIASLYFVTNTENSEGGRVAKSSANKSLTTLNSQERMTQRGKITPEDCVNWFLVCRVASHVNSVGKLRRSETKSLSPRHAEAGLQAGLSVLIIASFCLFARSVSSKTSEWTS